MPAPAAVTETSARHYPTEVEDAWVARAQRRVGGTPAVALARLAGPAADLSDLFTKERPSLFPDYGIEEPARLAYGCYFFPQTWVRTRFPLAEALDFRGWKPPSDRPTRVLDLGAGSGAAGWSAAQLLVARGLSPAVHLQAVDASEAQLKELTRLVASCKTASRGITIEATTRDLIEFAAGTASTDAFDLVVVSFALNEAFQTWDDDAATGWLRALAARMTPTGLLLLVEPALSITSRRLRTVAAPVIADGTFSLWGPDLGGTLAPPEPQGRFWDHEVRRWRVPESLRIVNKTLQRTVDDLGFSFVLLGRSAPAALEKTPALFRLTAPIGKTHGRREFTGLASDGGRYGYDLLERTVTTEDAAAFREIERGDVVRAETLTAHKVPDRFRVATAGALRVVYHPA